MSTPDKLVVANGSGSPAEVRCPYVDCNGTFAAGGSDCPTCRRAIAQCPNGHVMAAAEGFCDTCGYDAKADRANSPVSIRFVLDPTALLELIADAYREAALASINMRSATELFENLRIELAEKSDYHKAWDKLDEYVGRTLDQRLRRVVVSARERFVRGVIDGEVARLGALFTSDQDRGWDEWLRTFAEALNNWRLLLARALCEAPLAFSTDVQPVVGKLLRSTNMVMEERWPETFGMYRYLSQQEAIPALHRARLLVLAGEIELYQLKRPDNARKLFDEAEQLAPDESRVIAGRGEYCLQERKFAEALEYFQKVVAQLPQSSQGYMLMGDCYEQQREFERAEEAYQNAIRIAPGETGAYSRLLRLYGSPERLATYESRLLPLQETSSAIEPLNEYGLLLDLGTAYQQNGRYDDAHSWYDRAIQLNDRRLGAYVTKGYAYLEQEKPDEARVMFAKAIAVAPEAGDGYWGMYYLHDQGQEWPAATDAYEQSLLRLPELTGTVPVLIAGGKPAPTTIDELKTCLFETFKDEPTNATILNTLMSLAELYKKSGRVADAVQVYEQIRLAKGLDYEADYRNLVGNVKYLWKDYQGAVEAYLAAIAAATATEPVYHVNLSRAYQSLKQWNEARAQLAAAKAIKPDAPESSYAQEIAGVWNAEGNDHFVQGEFSEAIKSYEQAIVLDEKEAVYHSNLALAWEKLRPAEGRLEALENAVKALERAAELNSEEPDYENRLKRLRVQLRMAAIYGDHIVGNTPVVTALAIEMASDLVPFVADAAGELSDELKTLTEALRERIANSLGVRVSGIRFRGNEGDLPPGSYIIILMEVPLVMGTIAIHKRLFIGGGSQLTALDIKEEPASDPLTGDEAYWVEEEQLETLKTAGLETLSLMEYPVRHLEAVIRHNLSEFIDHQEVSNLLTRQPDTAGIAAAPEQLTAFTILLKALASEEVPVTALPQIQREFTELSAGKDLMTIVESVRSLPEVRPTLPGNNAAYSFYRLGERITKELAESVRTENGHQFLAILPEDCQEALAAVRNQISSRKNVGLVVEQAELRPLVRRLTELEWPLAPVLSLNELLPELTSQIVGEIELA